MSEKQRKHSGGFIMCEANTQIAGDEIELQMHLSYKWERVTPDGIDMITWEFDSGDTISYEKPEKRT